MPIAHSGPVAAMLGCAFALGAIACSGSSNDGSRTSARSAGTPATATATATATARKPDDGPSMDGDHSVIRQEAVGPLRVGEWRRPVMSFVYAISARAGRDSEDIIVVRGIGKDTVTLTFDNDTLRRVFVTHTGPRTVDGIGVGTPFAKVVAQPDARTTTRGTAQVATISRLCGVEFATDSVALSVDSISRNRAERPAVVRAISIGYCKP
jgi:hypothetical protein